MAGYSAKGKNEKSSNFSNNRGPTLRTPCGEKESAPISKVIFDANLAELHRSGEKEARHDRRKPSFTIAFVGVGWMAPIVANP
jgi:hypothetical protein